MGRPRTTGDWLANGDIKFNSLSRPSLSHSQSPRWLYNHQAAGQSSSRLDPTANALHLLSVRKILVRDTISPNRKRNKIKIKKKREIHHRLHKTQRPSIKSNQINFGLFSSFFLHFSFPSGWIQRESACRGAIELCVCGRGVTGRVSSAAPKYYITLSPLWLSSASPLHVMAMISSRKRDTDRYLPHPPHTQTNYVTFFFYKKCTACCTDQEKREKQQQQQQQQ